MIAIRLNPFMIEDMIYNQDWLAYTIMKITLGYFIYDTIDMLRVNNWEIT